MLVSNSNSQPPRPNFDPYHKWLGIVSDTLPPDHYRLLGVEKYESDLDVISSAADRQMNHLRKYQVGRQAVLSQQLLNEIAAAKVCLLNESTKKVYDDKLKSDASQETARQLPQIVAANKRFAGPKKRDLSSRILPVGASMLLLAMVVVFFWTGETTLENGGAEIHSANVESTESPLVDRRLEDEEIEQASVAERQIRKPKEIKSNAMRQISPYEAAKEESQLSVRQWKGTELGSAGLKSSSPEVKMRNEPTSPEVDQEPRLAAATKDKSPIPSIREVAVAKKQLNRLMTLPVSRRNLAEARLEYLSHDSVQNDNNLRYVAIDTTRDIAARNGKVKVALEMAKRLCDGFTVDEKSVVEQTLASLAKSTQSNVLERSRLLSILYERLWENTRAATFSRAKYYASKIQRIATMSKERELVVWAKKLPGLIDEVELEFCKLGTLKNSLDQSLGDPQSNYLRGRFLCLYANDFKAGLPYLAKGVPGPLRALAERELGRLSHEELLLLADDWWSCADEYEELSAQHIRSHAVKLYTTLLPSMKVGERSHALERMAEFEYSTSILVRMFNIVGSTWTVKWGQHSDWDLLEFLPAGRSRIVTVGEERYCTWRISDETIRLDSADGLRTYRLTPLDRRSLYCEHIGRLSNRLISEGVGEQVDVDRETR